MVGASRRQVGAGVMGLLYALGVIVVVVLGLWVGIAIGQLADAEHGRGWGER